MDYRVVLSPLAITDLQEIFEYIAKESPAAAGKLCEKLIERAESLPDHPKKGAMVPEFGDQSIRQLVYKGYRIVYRLRESKGTIEVSRFWHGARGDVHRI